MAVFVLSLFVTGFQSELHSEVSPGVGTPEECQLSCPQDNTEECHACCAALAREHEIKCRPDYKASCSEGLYDEIRCKAEEMKRERECERGVIDYNQCFSGSDPHDILNLSDELLKK